MELCSWENQRTELVIFQQDLKSWAGDSNTSESESELRRLRLWWRKPHRLPWKAKKNWLKKPHMFHQCFTNVSPTSCRSSPTGHDWALRCVAGPEICIRVSILFSGKVCCNHSGMEPAPRPGQPAEGRHEKNRPGERTSMETHHFLPVPSGHLTICYGIDGPFIDALGCFTYWKCWFSSSLR